MRLFAFAIVTGALFASVGCSSSSDSPATTSDTGSTDVGGDGAAATCSAPGKPTAGDADTHCAASDAGPAKVQTTAEASCHPAADDAGTGDTGMAMDADGGMDMDAGGDCPYGDTMYGQEADDDDCKYHLKWSSTPICEGSGGVSFTVIATKKADGKPLTGAGTIAETFTTTPTGTCDDASTHPGPNTGVSLKESTTTPGTYTGNLIFDKAGQWTVRFHFREECADTAEDSPHGHAAFHLTVP